MDARIDAYRLLGLEPGEAHVIRNAGGLVTDDALRSLAISQRALGTGKIILVHHTSCGMQGLDDEEFAAELERETGSRPAWRAGGFTDAADDVRASAALRVRRGHRPAGRGRPLGDLVVSATPRDPTPVVEHVLELRGGAQ